MKYLIIISVLVLCGYVNSECTEDQFNQMGKENAKLYDEIKDDHEELKCVDDLNLTQFRINGKSVASDLEEQERLQKYVDSQPPEKQIEIYKCYRKESEIIIAQREKRGDDVNPECKQKLEDDIQRDIDEAEAKQRMMSSTTAGE